jgi:para-aminobenzoate synthetase/4-amino-4-deoxychorismate lyase
MHGPVTGDPLELYRDLALNQRGEYNAYLDLGRFAIASASPELFFQRVGDDLLLRPMKGTAARGRTLSEDRQRARALRNSAKERAENVMIVDLIRNDVARVAEIGGVSVLELCRVERYETVLQLTSDIVARLRPGTGLRELFRAVFPSGSVTGAPKASTMALIRELEPTPRGVYCGAIGFVGPPQARVRARFNVAIRTAVVDRDTGRAVYGVGGGITWSSDAAAEHAEVLAKAAILNRRHQDFELIEIMRYVPERGLRNRDRHLRRMADSAEYHGFRFDLSSITSELRARLAACGPSRVGLRLHRDGRIVIDVSDLPPTSGPVTLAADDEPVDSSVSWLYHQTTLREPYEYRHRRHPDVDEVVMINERGELTETTRANLALRLDGRWWTPPLSSGCLPGVERARLLDLGRLGERVLHLSDLHCAERVAVLSSLRGWRSAVVINNVTACMGSDTRTSFRRCSAPTGTSSR